MYHMEKQQSLTAGRSISFSYILKLSMKSNLLSQEEWDIYCIYGVSSCYIQLYSPRKTIYTLHIYIYTINNGVLLGYIQQYSRFNLGFFFSSSAFGRGRDKKILLFRVILLMSQKLPIQHIYFKLRSITHSHVYHYISHIFKYIAYFK